VVPSARIPEKAKQLAARAQQANAPQLDLVVELKRMIEEGADSDELESLGDSINLDDVDMEDDISALEGSGAEPVDGLDGSSSAEEEEDEEEETLPETKMDKYVDAMQDEVTKHRSQLEELEKKDPTFFRFLKENDQNLLAFEGDDDVEDGESDSDADEEEEEEEEEDDEEEEEDKREAKKGAQEDESDASDAQDVSSHKKSVVVTAAMIARWKRSVEDAGSLPALRRLVVAFKACVLSTTDKSELSESMPMVVRSSEVFDLLMQVCFGSMDSWVETVLTWNNDHRKKKGEKARERDEKILSNPQSSHRWKNLGPLVRSFVSHALLFLSSVTEDELLAIGYTQLGKLSVYIVTDKRTFERVVTALGTKWSSYATSETLRITLFVGLRSLMSVHNISLNNRQLILKRITLLHISALKGLNATTADAHWMNVRTLVELYGVDLQSSYTAMFLFLRHYASTLRASPASLFNPSGLGAMWVWSSVLMTFAGEDTLRPLLFPLVQIIQALLAVASPSHRSFPFRYQLYRMLIGLSKAWHVYIPLVVPLMQILESVAVAIDHPGSLSVGGGSQKGGAAAKNKAPIKPLDFMLLYKVPKNMATQGHYLSRVVTHSLECLAEHLCVYARSIAFPELAALVTRWMRQLMKHPKLSAVRKEMKALTDMVGANANLVAQERSKSCNFSLGETEKLKGWERQLREGETQLPLEAYTQQLLDARDARWERLRQSGAENEKVTEEIEKEVAAEGERKEDKRQRKLEKKRARDEEQSKGWRGEGEEWEGEEGEEQHYSRGRKDARRGSWAQDDVVEEYEFSD